MFLKIKVKIIAFLKTIIINKFALFAKIFAKSVKKRIKNLI